MLTPAQLEEIEARANAATPGPWKRCSANEARPEGCSCGLVWSIPIDIPIIDVRMRGDDMAHPPQQEEHANGLFVAAARADVPALVAEVRRLRRVVESYAAHAYESGWANTAAELRRLANRGEP
jgi:hypothetical protein